MSWMDYPDPADLSARGFLPLHHRRALWLLRELERVTSGMVIRSPAGDFTIADTLTQLFRAGESSVRHHGEAEVRAMADVVLPLRVHDPEWSKT